MQTGALFLKERVVISWTTHLYPQVFHCRVDAIRNGMVPRDMDEVSRDLYIAVFKMIILAMDGRDQWN